MYIKNDGELRIGQLVQANIRLKAVEALWVPREAVLDLGLDKIVFVKERRRIQAKECKNRSPNRWIGGNQAGLIFSDEIASNAQYLVDSESFIKTGS